mgnify:CR=1 FL=1
MSNSLTVLVLITIYVLKIFSHLWAIFILGIWEEGVGMVNIKGEHLLFWNISKRRCECGWCIHMCCTKHIKARSWGWDVSSFSFLGCIVYICPINHMLKEDHLISDSFLMPLMWRLETQDRHTTAHVKHLSFSKNFPFTCAR